MTQPVPTLGTLTARDGGRAEIAFEREYAATPEEVWLALTMPERLGKWLGAVTGSLRVGGAYRVAFSDEPGTDQYTEGVVHACDPPRALVLSWHAPGGLASTVAVDVAPAGPAATRMSLHHRDLSRAQARGLGAGWHTYLDDLGTALAGGAPTGWDERFMAVLGAYQAQLPTDQDLPASDAVAE